MIPYPAYKDSGIEWIGKIPKHWEIKRLKYGARINPSRPANLTENMQCVFIPMEAVNADGSFDNSNIKLILELKTGYTYFAESDVIFAKITPSFENGKGAFLKNLGTSVGFGSTEFHVLRAITNKTTPEYLYFLTVSGLFRKLGEAFMQGVAGQQRVTEEFVDNFVIGIPPINDQRLIAKYLDRKTALINDLIAKKEQLIELLKEERTAIINEAVTKGLNPNVEMKDTGIEWLGKIPKHWDVHPVKYHFDVQLGKMLQNVELNPSDHLVPYLKAMHVLWGMVNVDELPEMWADQNELVQYGIIDGDLLVCEGGEVGRAGIVHNPPKHCIIQNALHRVRAKNEESIISYLFYVIYTINSEEWLSILCNKATISHFTRDKFVDLMIPIPPRQEQEEIVNVLDRKTIQIDIQIGQEKKSIELLQEYRTALISEVVTGKIDVREN